MLAHLGIAINTLKIASGMKVCMRVYIKIPGVYIGGMIAKICYI
jgi:hypothetical protein